MRRREFITLLGGAVAWPLAARAQQGDRVRRIGMLLGGDENDPLGKARISAFTQALAALGWTDGRNVRLDLRWAGGENDRIRALPQELVGLQPDIILATATAPVHSDVEIETTIPALGREPGGGLVVRKYSQQRIARRSYRRRPGATYRRSMS